MPLFREDLPTTGPRTSLGLIAAGIVGAAVSAETFLAAKLLLGLQPRTLSGDRLWVDLLAEPILFLPFWAVGMATLGPPLLLGLKRARLCGLVTLPGAVTLLSLVAAAALIRYAGAGAPEAAALLVGVLVGGPAAGLVLRRVARAPRATDADRLDALEETFR